MENRARFALEVAKAVSREIGPERTGIRLSPYSEFQGMRMPTEEAIRAQFTYLIAGLKALGLVYLHMTTPRVQGGTDVKNPKENLDWAIRAWGPERPLLLAGGVPPEDGGRRRWTSTTRSIISWSRLAGRTSRNPDLPFRIKRGIELARYDRETFYTAQSEKGYVDYPFSDEFVRGAGGGGGVEAVKSWVGFVDCQIDRVDLPIVQYDAPCFELRLADGSQCQLFVRSPPSIIVAKERISSRFRPKDQIRSTNSVSSHWGPKLGHQPFNRDGQSTSKSHTVIYHAAPSPAYLLL